MIGRNGTLGDAHGLVAFLIDFKATILLIAILPFKTLFHFMGIPRQGQSWPYEVINLSVAQPLLLIRTAIVELLWVRM